MFHELSPRDNFVSRFVALARCRPDAPALDDYGVSSLTYGDLMAGIGKLLALWRLAGLKRGDRVALNARSCANWAKVFLAAQIGGYVSVQIFKGFTGCDTLGLVNHCGARILYTEKAVFSKMDFAGMPALMAAVDLVTGELLASRDGFGEVFSRKDSLPLADTDNVTTDLDVLSAIMYTSGSTGNPKGVMLTNRNLSANLYAIERHFPFRMGESYLSVLPFSHIFGMVYDMLAPLCLGMHLVILGAPPVPANLIPALQKHRPHIFFSVPLILEKLIGAIIGDDLQSGERPPWEELSQKFISALGGNLELLVSGGAAINENLEKLLVDELKVPFVTGYGMTEAAPTISLGHYGDYVRHECGKVVEEIVELKIDSADGAGIPGEILIKGPAVFTGYYRNPEATAKAFTLDGWFRTGDVATLEDGGRVFIVGRCKNMILGPSGQNIFPEEIEVILNELPYVAESIVVDRNGKAFAIIVPDSDEVAQNNISSQTLLGIMKKNITHLNSRIPAYAAVSGFRLRYEPFAKTPKGTIKRFMYSE